MYKITFKLKTTLQKQRQAKINSRETKVYSIPYFFYPSQIDSQPQKRLAVPQSVRFRNPPLLVAFLASSYVQLWSA